MNKISLFPLIAAFLLTLSRPAAADLTPLQSRSTIAEDTVLRSAMESIRRLYAAADKGDAMNAVIDADTARAMQAVLAETGLPVTAAPFHLNMANYGVMETFLETISLGNAAACSLLELHETGGIGLREWLYDGETLRMQYGNGSWRADGGIAISSWAETVREWKYTESGWFFVDLDVPSASRLSEVLYSTMAIRVTPHPEEWHSLEAAVLDRIGYQSCNLFLVDWDADRLGSLDLNAAFDALFWIETGERALPDRYAGGIPSEEFEALVTAYLPVDAEKLRGLADYDPEEGTYAWRPFSNATGPAGILEADIAEVTDNGDGTCTASIRAVSEPGLTDRRFEHSLTYSLDEMGHVRLLSNKVEGGAEIGYRFRTQG